MTSSMVFGSSLGATFKNPSKLALVIATSASSSQGMKPWWRTAPIKVPESSRYLSLYFLQIRSISFKIASSAWWTFVRSYILYRPSILFLQVIVQIPWTVTS